MSGLTGIEASEDGEGDVARTFSVSLCLSSVTAIFGGDLVVTMVDWVSFLVVDDMFSFSFRLANFAAIFFFF